GVDTQPPSLSRRSSSPQSLMGNATPRLDSGLSSRVYSLLVEGLDGQWATNWGSSEACGRKHRHSALLREGEALAEACAVLYVDFDCSRLITLSECDSSSKRKSWDSQSRK